MTETLTNLQELTAESGSEQRHRPRVNTQYPIEVCGFSRHGRYFTERTFTLDVSDGGCKFRLRNEVEKGSVLALRVVARSHGQELDGRPVLFHVNWSLAAASTWTLGVSKLQAGAAWCASMPPAEEIPEILA
jgi:hypothetical protein